MKCHLRFRPNFVVGWSERLESTLWWSSRFSADHVQAMEDSLEEKNGAHVRVIPTPSPDLHYGNWDKMFPGLVLGLKFTRANTAKILIDTRNICLEEIKKPDDMCAGAFVRRLGVVSTAGTVFRDTTSVDAMIDSQNFSRLVSPQARNWIVDYLEGLAIAESQGRFDRLRVSPLEEF